MLLKPISDNSSLLQDFRRLSFIHSITHFKKNHRSLTGIKTNKRLNKRKRVRNEK